MIQPNSAATLLDRAEFPTLIAQAVPPQGNWQVLYESPILPVGAALLHTGKLLFICGSSNNPIDENLSADFLRAGSAVWNMKNGTFTRPPLPGDPPTDVFCPGHAFLADGRVLVAGGTLQYDPFDGAPDSNIFDPITQQWTKGPYMAGGRWYPTLLTLGDGQILAVSGLDQNGNLNQVPEIYDPNQNVWSAFAPTGPIPQYAHLFLMSDGRIFFSGGSMGGNYGMTPRIFTLPAGPGQQLGEQEVPGLDDVDFGNQSTSVLLPPAQDQRVMIIGGGNGDTATNRVSIVDLRSDNPTYARAANLNFARQHVSAVLLPDRTVFVCGGSSMYESVPDATLTAEIYNPTTDTWTVDATATAARLYHSGALLLPDGRVVAVGGNPNRGNEERRLEVYSPPYLSMGPRPKIQNAPRNLAYGQTFQIQTAQAENIQWVSLIKPIASTHSCDTTQRLVDLEIQSAAGNALTATVTNESNIAPPGWYMLFIVDQNGVPSVASWIQLN